MSSDKELFVYLDGVMAGVVDQTKSGRVSFTYDETYRRSKKSVPLSFSMPLEILEHPPKKINAFLAGLVPESIEAKERIRNRFNLRSVEPISLLRAIGRDAAGAVQILPPDAIPSDGALSRGDVRRLNEDEFAELLRTLTKHPTTWDPGMYAGRWSLAGAQSKVALFRFEDGSWGVPMDSTPTTYILKPAIPGFDFHDVNEFLSLRAAELLGLNVAVTNLLETENAPSVLVSTRYDRQDVNGRWQRLHQEDMCQALSVMPNSKYQVDGGPGVAKIAEVIAQLDRKVDRDESAERFFDALLFNVMGECTDAHAKNYSLLLTSGSQVLAPLYDIASHSPYKSSAPLTSAMAIGDEYRMAAIGKSHFLKAAKKLGINENHASERVDFMRNNIAASYASAAILLAGQPDLYAPALYISNSIHEMVTSRGWTR